MSGLQLLLIFTTNGESCAFQGNLSHLCVPLRRTQCTSLSSLHHTTTALEGHQPFTPGTEQHGRRFGPKSSGQGEKMGRVLF